MNNRNLPLALCGITFLAWCFLLHYKYVHLGYNDWDLSFFTQACWQLLHGSQFTSVTGINYFGDHSYFITLLYLPLFALVSHPLTLVFMKAAAFVIAAYLFFKIAKEELGQPVAVVLMVLYLIFPANIFSLLYEFNPESLAPPLLFWMFMAYQKKQWKYFFIASLLLMLIKENMALIVCAYGLYGLLSKNCPSKVAWFCLFVGTTSFYILVMEAVPHFRHLSYHPFVVRYGSFGHSIGAIAFNLCAHPMKVLEALGTVKNFRYLLSLFGPLLLLVLINWRFLFLASPILLQHMLSDNPSEHTIFYHYGSTLAPFIFLALMHTLKLCRDKFEDMVFRLAVFLSVFLLIIFLYSFGGAIVHKIDYHRDHLNGVRWDFIHAVPDQAGVIATFDFLAPLSLRDNLYAFHKVYSEAYQNVQAMKSNELNTGNSFVLPDEVRYVLIDYNDPWLKQSLKVYPQQTVIRLRHFLHRGGWKVIKHDGSIVLYER